MFVIIGRVGSTEDLRIDRVPRQVCKFLPIIGLLLGIWPVFVRVYASLWLIDVVATGHAKGSDRDKRRNLSRRDCRAAIVKVRSSITEKLQLLRVSAFNITASCILHRRFVYMLLELIRVQQKLSKTGCVCVE